VGIIPLKKLFSGCIYMSLKKQFFNKDVLIVSISIFFSFYAVRISSLKIISNGDNVLDAFIALFFAIGFFVSVKKIINFICQCI
jgi:hypothetical protein